MCFPSLTVVDVFLCTGKKRIFQKPTLPEKDCRYECLKMKYVLHKKFLRISFVLCFKVYNTPINTEKYKYLIKQANEKTAVAAE